MEPNPQLSLATRMEWEIWFGSLGCEDSLEKGKATHSSILAWRIPWTVYTSWGQKSRTRLSDFHFLLCTLELREGRGGCRPAYKENWTKKPLCPGSHRALLGISISVAGWDWAPSLRQRDTEAFAIGWRHYGEGKELKPVKPKGYESCIFIGRTDAEAETPSLWPPDGKN